MGEIVAAALVSHDPTIMLAEEVRRAGNGGQDTSLVAGFAEIRNELSALGADTLIIFDTHWFTTAEHIVAGSAHYRGTYTSDELPTIISDYEYDYAGAPQLAEAIEIAAKTNRQRARNITNENISRHYPTINLVHYLRHDEKILSVSVCQTAACHNYLDFGQVIAEAIGQTPGRFALLASGGMSHSFWPLDDFSRHLGKDPGNVISEGAREFDERILELWRVGDHATVIDRYPEYLRFQPEGFFGHYLMTIGALGGRDCTAKGRLMSNYENAAGTGQAHVWFDLGRE